MERRPDPPPLPTNDVRAVVVVTAAWVVALLALLPFASRLADDGRTWWFATCGFGIALGGVGIYYCRRRDRAIARDAARDSVARTTD